MIQTMVDSGKAFTYFETSITSYPLPERFILPVNDQVHPLCLLAAQQLQSHLENQQEWNHNFGLSPESKGIIIGKMFGVLVVKEAHNNIGFLSAFSGKLAGGNHHAIFVPPVFDALTEGSFLNNGMTKLNHINQEIKTLEEQKPESYEGQIHLLKKNRKRHSVALQEELFDQYHFLNQAGVVKSLRAIFKTAAYKNPPSGAGECAAPKLLQYAFRHKMQPLAMAEFWWGLSPKSNLWKHGHFYPACREKCEPILAHMLEGIGIEEV